MNNFDVVTLVKKLDNVTTNILFTIEFDGCGCMKGRTDIIFYNNLTALERAWNDMTGEGSTMKRELLHGAFVTVIDKEFSFEKGALTTTVHRINLINKYDEFDVVNTNVKSLINGVK